MACLVEMDGMGERVQGAKRVIQVCQDLWGSRGCLVLQVLLGPKGTMVLLENLDQKETVDQVVLQDFQVCLVQLGKKALLASRGTQDLKANQVRKERLGPKEK